MSDKPFYIERSGYDVSLRVRCNDKVLAKWSVRDGEAWAYQQAEYLCNMLNDVAERFAEQRVRPLRSILNACHSSNLFDTQQAATECIEGMPAYVLVIDIAIPKEKGGAK